MREQIEQEGPEKQIAYLIKLAQAPNLDDQKAIEAIAQQIVNLKGHAFFPHIIDRLEHLKVGVESFDEQAKHRMDNGIELGLQQIK